MVRCTNFTLLTVYSAAHIGLLAALGAELGQHRFQVSLMLDVHVQLFLRQRQNGYHVSRLGSLETLLLQGRNTRTNKQINNDLNKDILVNRYQMV